MKTEELRRYEEEFQAMREMLGTYCLELGLPSAETEALAGEAPAGAPPPRDPATPSDDGPTPISSGPSMGAG